MAFQEKISYQGIQSNEFATVFIIIKILSLSKFIFHPTWKFLLQENIAFIAIMYHRFLIWQFCSVGKVRKIRWPSWNDNFYRDIRSAERYISTHNFPFNDVIWIIHWWNLNFTASINIETPKERWHLELWNLGLEYFCLAIIWFLLAFDISRFYVMRRLCLICYDFRGAI